MLPTSPPRSSSSSRRSPIPLADRELADGHDPSAAVLRDIALVATDVDGTLTRGGALDPRVVAVIPLLAAAGVFLSEQVNDFLLRWIGLTSCIYAILDIKSDVLDRPELRSDAAMLGELTSLSPQFWGVVWIVVAILGASVFLLLSCREGRPPPRAG